MLETIIVNGVPADVGDLALTGGTHMQSFFGISGLQRNLRGKVSETGAFSSVFGMLVVF